MTTTFAPRPAAGTGDAVRIGGDTLQWPVWSTIARIVVTEPAQLDAAHRLVSDLLAEVDAAASRFRTGSEINQVHGAGGWPVEISPLLAELVAAALDAARRTDGDVDPTVGAALIGLGYDRDLDQLDRDVARLPMTLDPADGSGAATGSITVVKAPSWRRIRLADRVLTVPAGVVIDLGATAKAWTADRAAAQVAEQLGTGVLVSLGGDIATAGPAPAGGWQIRVQDAEGEPGCDVAIPAGAAIATSSTIRRQWRHGERAVHHILNPRTLAPAEQVWRTVTVAANSCVEANTLTTAATVRGDAAWSWLNGLGVPARLVRADGTVLGTASWPKDAAPRPRSNSFNSNSLSNNGFRTENPR
jgi:thiamine biosynthesis lipoprotein